MTIQINMPAMSPTMEEGTLARWLVKEGDKVSSGDLIAEIETDKATMELEAIDEGTVAKLLIDEGSEGVKVGTVIALIAEEGEDVSNMDAMASPTVTPVTMEVSEPEQKVEAPTAKPVPSDPELGADTSFTVSYTHLTLPTR